MSGSDLGGAMRAALNPLLRAAGFAAGQGGPEEMIFCAAHDEFSDRYPSLPQANEQPRDQVCCIDFIVDADLAGEGFTRVDLENHSLLETLHICGLEREADTLSVGLGGTPDEALSALAHALEALFTPDR